MTLAALEATLQSYSRGTALEDVPALRMLSQTSDEIEVRVKDFTEKLSQVSENTQLKISHEEGRSAVGGGSGPMTHPATVLISLQHDSLSPDEMLRYLRLTSPPVIARIASGRVVIDLRTVALEDEPDLLDAMRLMAGEGVPSTP